MGDSRGNIKFRRLGLITIIAVYLVILAGGIVRSTGSGMGCPDWPKCFGNWIPPNDESQIPENYKEIYSEKRKLKNVKLASYLRVLNFNELADRIENDQSIYKEANFNLNKTYIEYVNRVVGVLIGVFIFLVLIYSIPFLKTDRLIFYLSLLTFILVVLQGWIGSVVVSTNLLPFMITLHMALALVIVCLLIYTIVRSQKEAIEAQMINKSIYRLLMFLLIITFVQIISGTQVREEVDVIAANMNYTGRHLWIGQLGEVFNFHRLLSILVLSAHAYLLYLLLKLYKSGPVFKMGIFLITLLLAEFIFGIILSAGNIPAAIQPLHMLFASLIFGVQFFIFIILNVSNNNIKNVHAKDLRMSL
jgi:cytochrome c oxidase assembly protein subunit 15